MFAHPYRGRARQIPKFQVQSTEFRVIRRAMLIAFYKPYGVLSQFTSDGSKHRTLADFDFPKHVHPIGRLDATSEGLLLLSDEPYLNKKILAPENAHSRTYWAQVERIPSGESLATLQ